MVLFMIQSFFSEFTGTRTYMKTKRGYCPATIHGSLTGSGSDLPSQTPPLPPPCCLHSVVQRGAFPTGMTSARIMVLLTRSLFPERSNLCPVAFPCPRAIRSLSNMETGLQSYFWFSSFPWVSPSGLTNCWQGPVSVPVCPVGGSVWIVHMNVVSCDFGLDWEYRVVYVHQI